MTSHCPYCLSTPKRDNYHAHVEKCKNNLAWARYALASGPMPKQHPNVKPLRNLCSCCLGMAFREEDSLIKHERECRRKVDNFRRLCYPKWKKEIANIVNKSTEDVHFCIFTAWLKKQQNLVSGLREGDEFSISMYIDYCRFYLEEMNDKKNFLYAKAVDNLFVLRDEFTNMEDCC